MPYADAHSHLHDARIAPHLDAILRRARDAGVVCIHTLATQEGDWAAAALANHPLPDGLELRHSYGLHPWHAAEAAPGWPDRLKALLLAQPRAGIGETGLDGVLPGGITDVQWNAFRAQWELSIALRRPISLHGRRAWPALLDFILSQPPHPAGVLLHAYGGSSDALPALAAHNVSISLGGSLLNPLNRRARRTAAAVRPGRFLLETDTPDIAPSGTPYSEPSQLPATAAVWSSLLSLPLSTFAEQTTAAFHRLFP